jgi:hypothetical protein
MEPEIQLVQPPIVSAGERETSQQQTVPCAASGPGLGTEFIDQFRALVLEMTASGFDIAAVAAAANLTEQTRHAGEVPVLIVYNGKRIQ